MKKKESKQKKMNVRVDFTPMVDMMMLLITFFMLCTSLAKPQTMELSMPSKDKNLREHLILSQSLYAVTIRFITFQDSPSMMILNVSKRQHGARMESARC